VVISRGIPSPTIGVPLYVRGARGVVESVVVDRGRKGLREEAYRASD